MGLFFMSVGMEISGQLFLQKWKEVLAGREGWEGGPRRVGAEVCLCAWWPAACARAVRVPPPLTPS